MRLKASFIAAMFVAAPLAAGTTAMAADIGNCSGTQTCIWNDNDYQSKLASKEHGDGTPRNLAPEDEDRMDSWANNSDSYTSCGWSGRNATGDEQTWGRNSHDNNVSPLNSDEVSSWRTKYGC